MLAELLLSSFFILGVTSDFAKLLSFLSTLAEEGF